MWNRYLHFAGTTLAVLQLVRDPRLLIAGLVSVGAWCCIPMDVCDWRRAAVGSAGAGSSLVWRRVSMDMRDWRRADRVYLQTAALRARSHVHAYHNPHTHINHSLNQPIHQPPPLTPTQYPPTTRTPHAQPPLTPTQYPPTRLPRTNNPHSTPPNTHQHAQLSQTVLGLSLFELTFASPHGLAEFVLMGVAFMALGKRMTGSYARPWGACFWCLGTVLFVALGVGIWWGARLAVLLFDVWGGVCAVCCLWRGCGGAWPNRSIKCEGARD